ncbi:nucleotidyltransferase domain-containing protein [soil metagenome]
MKLNDNQGVKQKELIIRMLSALLPGVKIYLFGSRAKRTYKDISDIDLALDLGRELDLSELAQALNVLEAVNIIHKIDVVDLRSVPERLRVVILKEGVVWKE